MCISCLFIFSHQFLNTLMLRNLSIFWFSHWGLHMIMCRNVWVFNDWWSYSCEFQGKSQKSADNCSYALKTHQNLKNLANHLHFLVHFPKYLTSISTHDCSFSCQFSVNSHQNLNKWCQVFWWLFNFLVCFLANTHESDPYDVRFLEYFPECTQESEQVDVSFLVSFLKTTHTWTWTLGCDFLVDVSWNTLESKQPHVCENVRTLACSC